MKIMFDNLDAIGGITTAFAKVGTGPQECVEVRGIELIGKRITFRRNPQDRWQNAIITEIRDGRLYLDLH